MFLVRSLKVKTSALRVQLNLNIAHPVIKKISLAIVAIMKNFVIRHEFYQCYEKHYGGVEGANAEFYCKEFEDALLHLFTRICPSIHNT